MWSHASAAGRPHNAGPVTVLAERRHTDVLDAVSSAIRRRIDDGTVPGVLVLVAEHGRVVHLEAQGMVDSLLRLRQNAVDEWRPRAPVRVYQSPDDEEAPYADALVSVDRLRSRGADVTLRQLLGFDHVNSWIQAMPRAVAWFRSLD